MRLQPRCVVGLLLASGLAAPALAQDGFQVIVLRGGEVARASGAACGAVREEVLRQAPRPARAESEARPRRKESARETLRIEVHVNDPAWIHPYFARRGLHDPRKPAARPSRAVFRGPGPAPAWRHAPARR